jgi:phage portal protein BeeE
MPALLDRIAARRSGVKSFAQPPFWRADELRYGLLNWGPPLGKTEKIEGDFSGMIGAAYKANGVIFACMLLRMSVLSEARFMWRTFSKGRPQALFGDQSLALLEKPWPGGTTGDLLGRMEVVSVLAGNYYVTTADDAGRVGRGAVGPGLRLAEMRPDWVKMVVNSQSGDPRAIDAQIVGYEYTPPPSGNGYRTRPVLLTADEVAHFAPVPDPDAHFRGMSPLVPILEEMRSDKLATIHKSNFFENGATPQFAVLSKETSSSPRFEALIRKFKETHAGPGKAYGTLFLGDGADVRPLSVDFKQLDFKATQGAGETRMAAALGVHPTVVGLSEGMQGASLNAGNFGAAAKITGKRTFKPWWRNAAASLEKLLKPPNDRASLWYDDRDIAFLQDDEKDRAEIRAKDASVLQTLYSAGYTDMDAAVKFVQTGELSELIGKHSGMTSVQVQAAMAAAGRPVEAGSEDGDETSPNGNGRSRALARRTE